MNIKIIIIFFNIVELAYADSDYEPDPEPELGFEGSTQNIEMKNNPLEYTGTTELYDFLYNGYDKRVNARQNGTLSTIYQGLDVIWLNTGMYIVRVF